MIIMINNKCCTNNCCTLAFIEIFVHVQKKTKDFCKYL